VALVETVEQHALDALARGAGEFGRQPLARGFLQLVERFQAERLGELVVDRDGLCGASINVAVVSNSAGWPASFSLA
jgi:hypothetical protein